MSTLDVDAIEARLRERGIANYEEEVALCARVRELEAQTERERRITVMVLGLLTPEQSAALDAALISVLGPRVAP